MGGNDWDASTYHTTERGILDMTLLRASIERERHYCGASIKRVRRDRVSESNADGQIETGRERGRGRETETIEVRLN